MSESDGLGSLGLLPARGVGLALEYCPLVRSDEWLQSTGRLCEMWSCVARNGVYSVCGCVWKEGECRLGQRAGWKQCRRGGAISDRKEGQVTIAAQEVHRVT